MKISTMNPGINKQIYRGITPRFPQHSITWNSRVAGIAVFLLVNISACLSAAVPETDLVHIQQAVTFSAPPKPENPRRLLVFTLAKGYIHTATPWGAEALR